MKLRYVSSLAILSLLGACAEAPAPAPDPATIDRFIATLEAGKHGSAAEPLAKADRLVGSIEKVQAEKLDTSLAASLIGG